tara:strand:+ start:476 stop:1264 length:789 start_codon:yes stop_codon:yes gene_type:complete
LFFVCYFCQNINKPATGLPVPERYVRAGIAVTSFLCQRYAQKDITESPAIAEMTMRTQTESEEKLNTITHGIGFLLSLIGFALLFVFKAYDTFQGLLGVILYGISLSALYLASTLYHAAKSEKRKLLYRKLDHISIYLLIAGTYSPVVLIALEGSLGWTLFWLVWGIALVGTILKIFFTGRFEILSLLLYVLMGWLIVFDFEALKTSVSSEGLWLLMGGGMAYTGGIIFYVIDKIPYNHVIWHVFVLLGSILHYLFIFTEII